MCLYVDFKKTHKLRKNRKPNNKVTIYKCFKLSYDNKTALTHFQKTPFKGGFLKASRPLSLNTTECVIENGAIHAHTNQKNARNMSSYGVGFWVKGYALEKDIIAIGYSELAAKKVFIPKKELIKAINKYKKVCKWVG